MYDNLRKWLDIDDLLFQSRNKAYGAYQLRKKYNSVMVTGILIATAMITIAVVLPFILTPHDQHVYQGIRGYTQLNMEDLRPPQEQIYVPPAAPPPQSVHVEEIARYVPPKVVDSVPPTEKVQLSTDEYMNQTTQDKSDVSGAGNGDDLTGSMDGSETDEPFFFVEVMPSFKGGGLEKFRDWVMRRTNYPQAAFEKRIKGTVVLTFIVEKDGSVSNVTIVKSVDPLLDNEAIRAISESPKWTPGFQQGGPVRVRFLIPLNFMP